MKETKKNKEIKRELTLGRTEMIEMMTQRLKETKRGQERIKEIKKILRKLRDEERAHLG